MKTKQDWQFEPGDNAVSSNKAMTIITFLLYLSCINLAVVIAAPLSRYYLETPGFLSFRIMLIAMIIGAIMGLATLLLWSFLVLTKSYFEWRPVVLITMIGFTPVLIAMFSMGIDKLNKPFIHDISTDVNDPPVYQETKNLRQPGDNTTVYMKDDIANKQLAAYPEIKPLITELSVDEALIEATQVVKDMQWEFINVDYEQGIIEAYDTSKLFGFIDDIIIRVRPEGSGSRVDIRSSSRVGKGDLGKNAARIAKFFRTFRT